MTQQNFEVQRHSDQISVARQSGGLPGLLRGQALLQMVACGICGADVRVATGNKVIASTAGEYTTLGHEGVGRIVAINSHATPLRIGEYVVVLPHIHRADVTPACQSSEINPTCIGGEHTLHMGWNIDGCFTSYMVVPVTNLVPVSGKHLYQAIQKAPQLGPALFALVEPMLCTLSAYELIEMQLKALRLNPLTRGRALVIGCGPIGVLHSLILLQMAFDVCLTDTSDKRVALAQWCLGGRCSALNVQTERSLFDLVMVTASSAEAIRTGESLVRDGGIIYLFAGLNSADYTAMDHDKLFVYERLHRATKGILTTIHANNENKTVLYFGHSGYFEHLAPKAIEAVAANAGALDRAITGVIPGFSSTHIISRLPGGIDWQNEDGSPAIVSVLKGLDLRDRHCKLLVLAQA